MKLWTKKSSLPLLLGFFISLYLLFGALPIDQDHNHDLMARLMDAGHYPLFFALGLLLIRIGGWARTRVFLGLGGFATVVELIQPYFDRSESLDDLFYGILGLGLAVVLDLLMERRVTPLAWSLFTASALLFFLLTLVPSMREWRSIAWRSNNFPLLASFENTDELRLWHQPRRDIKLEIRSREENPSDHLLSVRSNSAEAASVVYLAGDLDWSRFGYFSFEIFLPNTQGQAANKEIPFHLRIDDNEDCRDFDSRFNVLLRLHAGWNRIDIASAKIQDGPKQRKLNLARIRKVYFFGEDQSALAFSLDNLRLSE